MDNLLKIAEWIEKNKPIIIHEWIEDANIITIFKKNNISTKKFADKFTIKIL